MIETPKFDWLALAPVLAPLAALGVALIASVTGPRWARRGIAAFVVAAGFVASGILAGVVFAETDSGQALIAESMSRDRLAALAQILIAGAGLLAVLVSWGENRRFHLFHHCCDLRSDFIDLGGKDGRIIRSYGKGRGGE